MSGNSWHLRCWTDGLYGIQTDSDIEWSSGHYQGSAGWGKAQLYSERKILHVLPYT